MEHEKINVKNTIILYCYRYIYKMKDGRLIVKFMTEPQEAHAKFQEFIRGNSDVVSCIREYVHEINFEYLGFTEPVKTEEKEEVQQDAEDMKFLKTDRTKKKEVKESEKNS